MSIYKIPLAQNVLDAALERITWALETLPRVCVSFSGGKDSGLMLHLTAMLARQLHKKIDVLFIDWEAQFSCTIDYVEALRARYSDVIERFYWVALPLTTQNSLSQFQPEWQCWEPGTPWVRQPPTDAITDPEYFSFYQPGMTFEQFVREFADWYSEKRPAGMMVGIRADESYNRFVAIANSQKQRFADDKPWTTSAPAGIPGIFTRFMTGKLPISGPGSQKPECRAIPYTISCIRPVSQHVTCVFVSPLARNSVRDYGYITSLNPSAGQPCVPVSAV